MCISENALALAMLFIHTHIESNLFLADLSGSKKKTFLEGPPVFLSATVPNYVSKSVQK
jgi:hypothetical protein